MQFRERRRVIQVIRTTYDPEMKRGRSELVGKLDKAAPAITDALRAACTAEELAEVATYLDGRQETQRSAAVRAGAETLPEQMRKAAEYFHAHQDDKALAFAAEIRGAWDELKSAMRKAGFSKSKVRHAVKAAKPADKPAVPEAARESAKESVVKGPKTVKVPVKKAAAPKMASKPVKAKAAPAPLAPAPAAPIPAASAPEPVAVPPATKEG